MRALLALLLVLSAAPAARAESVRDDGTVVGTAGAQPVVSDGVRFVLWIKAGRLWVYDDLRARRTSRALPADRCELTGGSSRGVFLLHCRGRGPLVWDRGVKALRGALPTDFLEFVGRHWAVGSDTTGAPIAVHLGTGRRVRGEPWTGSFDPDSREPDRTVSPDNERHRGDWTLVWDEGVILRRRGRFHRRLTDRCRATACAMQIESGWITLVGQDAAPRARVVAYDLRTRRLTTWTARGGDVTAAHTRSGLFVASSNAPLRRLPRP